MKDWRGKECITPGCTNKARCKEMCTKCYNREKIREKRENMEENSVFEIKKALDPIKRTVDLLDWIEEKHPEILEEYDKLINEMAKSEKR
jgi:hypothetical protein